MVWGAFMYPRSEQEILCLLFPTLSVMGIIVLRYRSNICKLLPLAVFIDADAFFGCTY